VRQLTILGQPETEMLATALLQAEVLIKDGQALGVRIVPYPGHKGRKLLLASLTLRTDSHSFNSKHKGFGFLSRSIAYYSPTAVFVLFRYLAMRHSGEAAYLSRLTQAAKLCGSLYLKGRISIRNQSDIAFMIGRRIMDGL
jgi:hypothetical protein